MDPLKPQIRSASMSALSCLGCKARKIRCDRVTPTCDGCFARRENCAYPERRKKRSINQSKNIPYQSREERSRGSISPTLDARIRRVEAICSQLAPQSDEAYTPKRSSSRESEDSGIPLTPSPISYALSLAAQSPHSYKTRHLGPTIATAPTAAIAPTAAAPTSNTKGLLDPSKCLEEALASVLALKRRSLEKEARQTGMEITAELSKTCVEKFRDHYEIDTFPGFINIKLMHLIPDLINMSEITIEPAALVLFWSVIYHGSLMLGDSQRLSRAARTRKIYAYGLHNIGDWLQHNTRTKTDVIAAVLLTKAALQQWDFEFSWNMYKIVCESVQQLNMHNIDHSFSSTLLNPDLCLHEPDHHRQGLWGLIFVDLFFCMFHDKPAIITAHWNKWHVNFPWLEADTGPAEQTVPRLIFLVNSKLSFIILRFLDMIEAEKVQNTGKAIHHVEQSCVEIEAVLEKWPVKEIMQTNEENLCIWWMLFNVLLSAYSAMMIMHYKAAILGPDNSKKHESGDDVPITTHSISTARQVMKLVSLNLEKSPDIEAVSSVFGGFRCCIAHSCLAKHVLHVGPTNVDLDSSQDMDLLLRVAQHTRGIAEADSDLMPLAQALDGVNNAIREKWNYTG